MEGRKSWLPPLILSFLLLLIVPANISLASGDTADYTGWKILEVVLEEEAEDVGDRTSTLLQEMEDYTFLQILGMQKDKDVAEVAVSPQALEELMELQEEDKISFSIIVDDLSEINVSPQREDRLASGEATFERFMTVEEITAHLEDLPNQFPDKVKLTTAGYSVENRPIYLVTVTSNVNSNTEKPIIFVDGGVHAREWISPASALFVINQLVKQTELTDSIEWRIIPLANPDGYAYTWTNDRLWRKNRADNPSSSCDGVDLNRNFGYYWGGTGSSGNACSDAYRGRRAFSEPESRAIRDAMTPVQNLIKAYVTLHCYGQYILHPWGYGYVGDHYNVAQLSSVGNGMANAIRKRKGPRYTVGGSAALLYPAAGASDDWAAGTLNIPLSYTFELGDTGRYGFLLPDDRIWFSAQDAWLALSYLARELM